MDTDICKQFGENVRRIRRARDVTQEKLADDAGIHRTYLSKIERLGQGNPTISIVARIAKALGVSPGSLLD